MKKREANESKNMSQYISSSTQICNLENKQETFKKCILHCVPYTNHIPHANGHKIMFTFGCASLTSKK